MGNSFRAYELIKKLDANDRRYFKQHWVHHTKAGGHILELMFNRLCEYADGKLEEKDLKSDKIIKPERRNELYEKILETLSLKGNSHSIVTQFRTLEYFFVLKSQKAFDLAFEQLEKVIEYAETHEQINLEILALQVKSNYLDEFTTSKEKGERDMLREKIILRKTVQYETALLYNNYFKVGLLYQKGYLLRELESQNQLYEFKKYFKDYSLTNFSSYPITSKFHLLESRARVFELSGDWNSAYSQYNEIFELAQSSQELLSNIKRTHLVILINFLQVCMHSRRWERFELVSNQIESLLSLQKEFSLVAECKIRSIGLFKEFFTAYSFDNTGLYQETISFIGEKVMEGMEDEKLELYFALLLNAYKRNLREDCDLFIDRIFTVKSSEKRADIIELTYFIELVILLEAKEWKVLEIKSKQLYNKKIKDAASFGFEKKMVAWFKKCAGLESTKPVIKELSNLMEYVSNNPDPKAAEEERIFITQFSLYFDWESWFRKILDKPLVG